MTYAAYVTVGNYQNSTVRHSAQEVNIKTIVHCTKILESNCVINQYIK